MWSYYIYATDFSGDDLNQAAVSIIEYKTQVIAEIIEKDRLSYYSLVPISLYKQFDNQHNNENYFILANTIKPSIAMAFSDGKFDTLFDDIEFPE